MKHDPHHKSALLERAQVQWLFGDWESLAQLVADELEGTPDWLEVTLLIAAANFQLGNKVIGRQKLQLAQQAGCCVNLIEKVLVSGVHNTLGRVAASDGQTRRALQHFAHAIEAGPFAGDVRLILSARAEAQFAQLNANISKSELVHSLNEITTIQANPKNAAPGTANPCHMMPRVKQLSTINLGEGWAGNTVNTVIFRHHGVLTWKEFQYTAFYRNETALCMVQRHLATNHISTYEIEGQYNLRDAHNSISLGVDRDGHIHISYDHHATKLRYRRSRHPEAIDDWTDELPMTGANEDRVTYPSFILPRAGHPLTLLYRDGIHNKGSARLKTYDETTQIWTDRPTPILSGAEQKPWTSNAYWNHPAIGNDGSLHLSFVWRTETLGNQQLVNNINIGYAWSPDNGLNWFTSLGQPYQLPITQVNAEVIWPVSPGSNLINQSSMALDSLNRPHIVFYSNDKNGIPQYQYLRFNGKTWLKKIISGRTKPFNLQGGGTLKIPISRPDIVIDRSDNAYAIFRGDLTDDYISLIQLNANEITDFPAIQNQIALPLWKHPLGYAEPVLDRIRWHRDQILTLFIQFNEQPDGDRFHKNQSAPVWLVDYRVC